ncbi:MAG: SDR family oxidoreductase [Deltaproteobacteria bacterium]|nr:SDR family oxidoreductase [Deltaproteobacteria bacterium]
MTLRGRAVLITGASRGLGEALAREVGGRGARVVLVARDGAAVEAVAQDIRAHGGEAWSIAADVADKDAVHRVTGLATALAGPIDVLVHNASTLGPVPLSLLLDTDCEDLERAFAVNVVGPFRWTKVLAGSMALRGGGLVVHVSSDAAVEAYPTWGAYGASKAALDHLTRIWAAELEGTGVRFLGVDPGEMDTRMHAEAMPDADRSKLARPADVARAVADRIERAGESQSGARVALSASAEPSGLAVAS